MVGGRGTLAFILQEAIDGVGAGKDVDVKLCFQKLNLAAVGMDRGRKGQRWGGQLGSREDVGKTWTPGGRPQEWKG